MTEEQLKRLSELVFIGEWVANSFEEPTEGESNEDIEQIVYGALHKTAYSESVDYSDEDDAYFPSEDFEFDCMPKIENYDDKTFWNELFMNLSMRDLVNKFGDKLSSMNEIEIIEERNMLFAQYESEFEENGLENLVIKS